jgi:trans-aconitate 2-methyltransferase
LRGSEVLGLDNSPEMLGRAQTRARSGLRFELGAIEDAEGTWDLIFSHAALQWADEHDKLIPRLIQMLNPGGQIVVQMPSNHRHPAHVLIADIAAEEPYRSALKEFMRHSPVLSIDAYAQLLHASGGSELTVFEKIYPHVLPNADALAEWMAGTALVPYFERLPEAHHNGFMAQYRERLRARWPNPPVFYGFRRTIFAATRPS